jgi:hypothetical protein
LAPAASEEAEARPDAPREEVETTLVQIDVSVTEDGSDGRRSIPGLQLQDLLIEIDGAPLEEATIERATLDLIEARPGDPLDAFAHRIVLLVDLNFVSLIAKRQLADTIRELARNVGDFPGQYRVIAFRSTLEDLTGGFTRSPALLRRAAEQLRNMTWTPRFANPIHDPASIARSGAFAGVRMDPMNTIGRDPLPFQMTGDPIPRPGRDGNGTLRTHASGRALESVLRAHFNMPGRKIILLFSSAAASYLTPWDGRAVLQQGISVWPVESGGMRVSAPRSSFDALARASGGLFLGRVGRGMALFEAVRDSLARYYLVSRPVEVARERDRTYELEVRLREESVAGDHDVVAPRFITILGRRSRLYAQHLAASLDPERRSEFVVASSIHFPERKGLGRRLPIRFWMRLADLTWIPVEETVYEASLLLDAVVIRTSDEGISFPCGVSRSAEGTVMRLPRPPSEGSRQGIILDLECDFPGEGVYEARATITDIHGGRSAVGSTHALVQTSWTREWSAHAPSVEIATGRDLVIEEGWERASRDREREAWRPAAGEDIRSGDRIALRYVLCGPDATQVHEGLRHVLLRDAPETGLHDAIVLGREAVTVDAGRRSRPFCESVRVVLEPHSLGPGHYAFLVMPADEDVDGVVHDLETVRRRSARGSPELVFVRFEVE